MHDQEGIHPAPMDRANHDVAAGLGHVLGAKPFVLQAEDAEDDQPEGEREPSNEQAGPGLRRSTEPLQAFPDAAPAPGKRLGRGPRRGPPLRRLR